ncbi:MAG TPA: HAD-IIB family hydrolase [Polyangia bacterium]
MLPSPSAEQRSPGAKAVSDGKQVATARTGKPVRFHVLACDYDGTLATHGQLFESTRAALQRVKATGRKLVMVTGRRIDDLQATCPDLSPFDCVVAENGAVLYWPSTHELHALVDPPPATLAETLRQRGVPDVAQGKVIVATWQPYETLVLETIRDLQLEMQVIFNKGAVMVLPSGVNKGFGLQAALQAMRLSPHNVVAVGDAENDHALLAGAECGVAVANALHTLKERADLVTKRDHGAGVEELAEQLIADDLAELSATLLRHDIAIGTDEAGRSVTLPAHGVNVLLAGTSGGGKSTFATAFVEHVAERGYQYCVLDPEGDYADLPRAVAVGTAQSLPSADDAMKVLEKPEQSAIVSLVSVPMNDRPIFFEALLRSLEAERKAVGRPHWILVDEAHHVAPRERVGETPAEGFTQESFAAAQSNVVLITVHPQLVAQVWLAAIDVVVVVGVNPVKSLADIAAVIGVPSPVNVPKAIAADEALVWWPRRSSTILTRVRTTPPQTERRRHVRKYIEGTLAPEKSFYFRGAEGKLNLRAQNLNAFLQLADGVDDASWLFHLRAGDYSRWFGEVIRDRELADEVAGIERARGHATAADSRARIRNAVEKRYVVTAP